MERWNIGTEASGDSESGREIVARRAARRRDATPERARGALARSSDPMAPDPFNLSTLSAALLPRKTSASVNLLLAVADMKRGDLRAFRRNVESAVRCYSDAAPSIRFSTLSGRGLTLLSEALGTGRVAFVRALLLDYRVDWNVPVDSGGDALKRAFESKEQFATLIAGEFELRLTPRTLEEYVAERRPELTALLRARRAETTRGRKLCETVSYESTSTERCAPAGDDSSSEVLPRAEEAMRVQEFAFRAEEDSADSLDVDFETRDMSVIVQIKSAVNDTETEITDMEFNNEYIDENRLVDLEQNLEKEESFLDGLANEADERGEELTDRVRHHRRHVVGLIHRLFARIEALRQNVNEA